MNNISPCGDETIDCVDCIGKGICICLCYYTVSNKLFLEIAYNCINSGVISQLERTKSIKEFRKIARRNMRHKKYTQEEINQLIYDIRHGKNLEEPLEEEFEVDDSVNLDCVMEIREIAQAAIKEKGLTEKEIRQSLGIKRFEISS